MLRGAENSELYREYYEILCTPEAKHAFLYMVGWASTLKSYDFFPSSHGHIKDLRFLRGNDWDFAFIPNQRWMLFYFRKPCLKLPKYSREEILGRIPGAKETNAGEFTARLKNVNDVMRLAGYIEC
ncbi:hypothetical protein OH720_09650 [Pseudomonas sp. WJP1]|uniref:hypothetical protein n=1 Tax=Pseudomonas sp. WJP1 TaxID=2986947 RepID=UPI0023495CFB|nr:hypothetical protein [Pseudomonas sp. WJP1]WCM53257.1 hypothetical protein OH720_09650 [Pseudomonas sp. WJP1]